MHLARRWKHGPELTEAIRYSAKRVLDLKRKPFLRLHVLGDFYSLEYAKLWFEEIGIPMFGYTHHRPDSEIGSYLASLPWSKFSIRFSWRADVSPPLNKRGAVTVEADTPEKFEAEAARFNAIPCPVQTGKSSNCVTCMLCWETERNIAFKKH